MNGDNNVHGEKLILEFVRKTLGKNVSADFPNMRLKSVDGKQICTLRAKVRGQGGRGNIVYVFEGDKCVYSDWHGKEIDYSTKWAKFLQKKTLAANADQEQMQNYAEI